MHSRSTIVVAQLVKYYAGKILCMLGCRKDVSDGKARLTTVVVPI